MKLFLNILCLTSTLFPCLAMQPDAGTLDSSRTALVATTQGRTRSLEQLLNEDRSASPIQHVTSSKRSPTPTEIVDFYQAAFTGNLAGVQAFLDIFPEHVNTQDYSINGTVLHNTAFSYIHNSDQCYEVFKYLLEHGADPRIIAKMARNLNVAEYIEHEINRTNMLPGSPNIEHAFKLLALLAKKGYLPKVSANDVMGYYRREMADLDPANEGNSAHAAPTVLASVEEKVDNQQEPPSKGELNNFLKNAAKGDLAGVQKFVKSFPGFINARIEGRCPALHLAAERYMSVPRDGYGVCEYLLDNGATFDQCPADSESINYCCMGKIKHLDPSRIANDDYLNNIYELLVRHNCITAPKKASRSSTRQFSGVAAGKFSGIATANTKPSDEKKNQSAGTRAQAPNNLPAAPRAAGKINETFISKNKSLLASCGLALIGLGYWLWQGKKQETRKDDSQSKTEKKKEQNSNSEETQKPAVAT